VNRSLERVVVDVFLARARAAGSVLGESGGRRAGERSASSAGARFVLFAWPGIHSGEAAGPTTCSIERHTSGRVCDERQGSAWWRTADVGTDTGRGRK
jgi:hypothetical protein